MVMRAMYVPYKSSGTMEKVTRPHRAALAAPRQKQAAQKAEQRLKESGATFTRDESGLITGVKFARTAATSELIALVRSLPFVRDVNLYETNVTDEGLAELKSLKRLNNLNLGFCQQLTDKSFDTLVTLKQLRVLNLGFCRRITPEGFARLNRIPHLLILNLSVTSFSDANVSALTNMSRLSILDIDNTPLTSAGIQSLAELKSLRALRMVGVNARDTDLDALSRVRTLRHLNLRDVPVSDDAIARFQKALPECTIKR